MFETVQITVVYAVVLGALYLLMSLGFSVVCGVLRVFHMGYGVTFLVAIYGSFVLTREFGVPLIPAILGMLVIQAVFTLVVIYFPIVRRYTEHEEILLTSLLLVSLVVENFVNERYPANVGVSLPTTVLSGTVKVGAASIPSQMLLAAAIALLTAAAFVVLLMKTRLGLVIRAVSQDTDSARLMGANIEWVYPTAMLLSVIPPTICMLTIAPFWAITPTVGASLMQTAIMVSILGGLGNIRGSILAAFVVSSVSSVVTFTVNPRLSGLAILIMVFIVLIFKPEGIVRSETIW